MESIGIIGRLIPAHGNNQRSSGGYFLRKFQLSTVEGQFCTMDSHLIHSDPVLRLKGQECQVVNGQGSILYNEKSSLLGLVIYVTQVPYQYSCTLLFKMR